MVRPVEIKGSAEEAPAEGAVSLLDYGVGVRLVWAGGLAAVLWVAAAWALGWLP